MPWVFYLVKKQEGDTVILVFSRSFLVPLLDSYQICFPNSIMCISSPPIQKLSKAKYLYLNPNTLPVWEVCTFQNNTQTRDNPFLFLGVQVNSCTNLNNLREQKSSNELSNGSFKLNFIMLSCKRNQLPYFKKQEGTYNYIRTPSTSRQLSAWHFSNGSVSHHRWVEL